jgi:hypothetical protein
MKPRSSWLNPLLVAEPHALVARVSIDISRLTIWIRTASSIATAARAHRAANTVAKSLDATVVADRVAPVLAVAEVLAVDVAVVAGDLASSSPSSQHRRPVDHQGWLVRVDPVRRGRQWAARDRRCDLAWVHPGRAVLQFQVDSRVAPTCSSNGQSSAAVMKTTSARCADC